MIDWKPPWLERRSSPCRILKLPDVDLRFSGLNDAEFDAMRAPSSRVIVAKNDIEKRSYRNAIVLPPQRWASGFHDGLVLRKDLTVELLSTRKYSGDLDTKLLPPEMPRREGRFLYAGLLHHHYGHFLVESMTRLWAFKGRKIDGIVFVTVNRGPPPKFVYDTIRLLFGDIAIRIESEPAVYERIIVPDRALKMRGPVYPEFLDIFRRCDIVPNRKAGKVYVSRSKLTSRPERVFRYGEKCIVGESYVDQVLARNGVNIFHPENETLEAQIALFRGAKAIAGLQGSGLHNIVYAADKEMFVLSREKRFWTPGHLIDAVRPGRSTHIWADELESSGDLVPDLPGSDPKLFPRIIDPATALERLSETGFVKNLSRADHMEAREQAIAEYNLRKLCAMVDVGIDENDDSVIDGVKIMARRYTVASERRFLDEVDAFFGRVPREKRTSRLWREVLTVV